MRAFEKQASSDTVAMILMNHGVFTFGETTQEAYNQMIEVISQAEEYLQTTAGVDITSSASNAESRAASGSTLSQATLRKDLSKVAGRSMLLFHSPNEEHINLCRGMTWRRSPLVGQLRLITSSERNNSP